MNRKRVIRIIAIVLAVLLAGGVVVGALISALAEAPATPEARNQQAITMEYLEGEQALHITQRLVYINRAGDRLDAVVFYAAGNMFRRESALMYETDDLEAVFFAGYAPGGIDLRSVRCDGEDADYGFQGEAETYLRVACDVAPGERCAFEFDYYLLLTRCGAFQGVGDTDVRLSAFCFIPAVYDARYGEFTLTKPIPHARWLHCDAADYTADVVLPDGYVLAGTGAATKLDSEGNRWRVEAENARDFALSFGKRWRVTGGESASGVAVRVYTNVRGAGRRALDAAISAIDQCEAWFGALPVRELDIVQSDYPLGEMNFTGAMWLPSDLFSTRNAGTLAQRIRYCVAQQYFGLSAYVEPSADAWMSDAVSEYVACLLLEAVAGRDKFLAAVNREWVSALQQTVPGGLHVTSDAALFSKGSYDIVVRVRGAVVLHELRLATGLEGFIAGLNNFCQMGQNGKTLTELDFVSAFDAATGGSWTDFLTDWLFNVGDYVGQDMEWYE